MISVDSYEFVSISSSFSFDLAGATLFLVILFFLYFNSIHEDFFILYFSGIPEVVFDTEENEDRIYNLHFNYPFFLQIRYSNKQFILFYFFKVLICVVYPDSYPQSLCINVDLGELVIIVID